MRRSRSCPCRVAKLVCKARPACSRPSTHRGQTLAACLVWPSSRSTAVSAQFTGPQGVQGRCYVPAGTTTMFCLFFFFRQPARLALQLCLCFSGGSLSLCLFVSLSLSLSFSVSLHSVCLPACLSLSLFLSVLLCVSVSLCLSVCLSVCLSLSLSV